LIFLVPFALTVLVQILVWRLLVQVVPRRLKAWVPWVLVVIHAPLIIYLSLRLTGQGFQGFAIWLRPFSRLGLYFQAPSLMFLLIWGLASFLWTIRARLQKPKPEPEIIELGRRSFLRKATLGGLGVLAVAGGAGVTQAYGDPEISRLDLRFQDLPEGFDGFRILHLSDLHAGPLASLELLKRWRFLAERERADILIITGDFVDSLPEELDIFEEAFRDFSAPLGRFAVLGNHDFFTDPVPIWWGLQKMGIQCLENQHAVIERDGSRMAIFGIQDPMATYGRFRGVRFGPGPRPMDAAARIPPGLWRLCLSHRPNLWYMTRKVGARLTLSGHTHGGQINLIPGISSAKLLTPYVAGLYRNREDMLFVNRGLGVVGLPMRIGAPPEIAVITLRRREIPSMLPAENQLT